MQSVELLLDPATDAAVRAEWAALSAAGLPSQADHRGETNAPHVSVAVAGAFPGGSEPRLVAAATRLPIPLRLGAPVLFGGRRLVLARLVVTDRALLDVHTGVWEAVADATDPSPHTVPGKWVPHVTLARGVPAEGVATALEALRAERGGVPELVGEATTLRRWDSDARRAWAV